MNTLRTHGWRFALVAAGVLIAAGGRMHPDADAEDSLRQELATMTADDRWVTGHTLIALGTLAFALGLVAAHRSTAWPAPTRRTLGMAAVVFAVYVVETVFHLAAAVDSEALAHGDSAPVAMTHVGLSIVMYPITGWALVLLALALGRAWGGWRRAVAAIGVLSGILQVLSVPTTILMPDVEATPLFAGAGISLAVFALLTGVLGAPRRTTVSPRESLLVG